MPNHMQGFAEFVTAVPSGQLPTNWFLDAVMAAREDGEEKPFIIASFVTPQGVNKFWFDVQSFTALCTAGLETAKKARDHKPGPKLDTYRSLPKDIDQDQVNKVVRDVFKQNGDT